MSSKGQKPLEMAEFDVEIRESHPGTSQWVRIPEDPLVWSEALRESLKHDNSVYINVYSVLGDEIQISVNPYPGRAYKDALCFSLDFPTLDKLKRAIDFVHQEALRNQQKYEVSSTAPK